MTDMVGASKGRASSSMHCHPLLRTAVTDPPSQFVMMKFLLQFGPHLLVSMVEKDPTKVVKAIPAEMKVTAAWLTGTTASLT